MKRKRGSLHYLILEFIALALPDIKGLLKFLKGLVV